MSNPFTKQDPVGQPTWTGVPVSDTTYTRLSATGQTVTVQYGFGTGGFGAGGFGTGEGTQIISTTNTTWTGFTTR